MSQFNCKVGRSYSAVKVVPGPVRTRTAFELSYRPVMRDVIHAPSPLVPSRDFWGYTFLQKEKEVGND